MFLWAFTVGWLYLHWELFCLRLPINNARKVHLLYDDLCTIWIKQKRSGCDFSHLLQRVENTFSTRCRLLRKVLNFVFLWRKMYDGTSTEQKTKNAKSAVNSMFAALLQSLRQHFVLPSPFTQGSIKRLINFIGVLQELYRQSEADVVFRICFLFCLL